jgi:hypothetical protein
MNTSKITAVTFGAVTLSLFCANFYLLRGYRTKTNNRPASVFVTYAADVTPRIKAITPMPLVNTTIGENKEENVFKKENGIITFNALHTPGLVYRIQVLSSKTQVPLFSSSFDGLEDVREYYANGDYIYTVGTFTSADQAQPLFAELDDKGHNDHCLVAFKDDRPLSVKDAMNDVAK